MIEQLLKLARPEIIALKAYSSARREYTKDGIFLNANENPFAKLEEPRVHRYPEPQPEKLRETLAKLYDVDVAQILMTRGCDEGIDLLVRTFCSAARDAIMVCPPTYDMYALCAAIQNAQVISVPLMAQTFALDIDNLFKAWQPHCKLIFLCSPNNPTGNMVPPQDVLLLCERLKEQAIVVVDEAYIEFSNQTSMSCYLEQFPNLVVLRTLSKAYGLAGARCGVVLAHPMIIALLEKVISPYPLASPVIEIVLRELQQEYVQHVHAQVDILKSERENLSEFLARLPFVEKVWQSEANFILLKVKDANALMQHCASEQIIIRDRSHMLNLPDCVRISIGTPEENARLKKILQTYQPSLIHA